MTSDDIGRAVVTARAWRAVRTGGPGKWPHIEQAGDVDQPVQAAAPPPPPPSPPAPARDVAQPAPAVVASPVVSQPAASTVTTAPASPRVTSAPQVKNVRKDDGRDLIDQVPSNLRKRFGF
jgi:hypothetical protein